AAPAAELCRSALGPVSLGKCGMKVKLFVQKLDLRVKATGFWGNEVYALNQGDIGDIEAEINAWLGQNLGIKVVNIHQSVIPLFDFGSVGIITSVWYEESPDYPVAADRAGIPVSRGM